MARFGHPLRRAGLGVLFTWLGLLKTAGHPTATTILARRLRPVTAFAGARDGIHEARTHDDIHKA
jgi:spore maturation protein SpmA